MEESVTIHLKEHDIARAKAHPLAMNRARFAVATIAAATVLSKKTKIRLPGAPNETDGLELDQLLPDWDEAELATLLSRPIFDEAIYGAVRFHHREVREFLTAEWLWNILQQDRSRVAVEALLFKNQYGLDVVVPTFRSVLPWLALKDDRVRTKLTAIAPDLLLGGGDPSQLPVVYRTQLLRQICKVLAEEGRAGHSFDITAVQRFSMPDIEDAVLELFETYQDNDEVCQLLLRMVWQGELKRCQDHADRCARKTSAEGYTRINGIRAMGVVGTPARKAELEKLVGAENPPAPHQVYAELVETFGGDELPVANIATYLERTDPPENYTYDSLEYALDRLAQEAGEEGAYKLATILGKLFRQPLYLERGHVEMSQRYQWLASTVAYACINLAEKRSDRTLTPEILSLMSLIKRSAVYSRGVLPNEKIDALIEWPELNEALFWNEVTETRVRLKAKNEGPLQRVWQVSTVDKLWSFQAEDFDRMLAEVTSRSGDDALVAISVCFSIYREAGRQRRWRECLKRTVAGNAEQKTFLTGLLNPPPLTNEMKRHRAGEARFERRLRDRERGWANNRAEWKRAIQKDVEKLKDTSPAKDGTILQTQRYLMLRVQEAAKKDASTKWAHTNWQSLIPEFGVDVAEAYQHGAVAYWRDCCPKVRSEDAESWNSTPYAVVFGLTGLGFEAESDPDWVSKLTEAEAELATRYALWEMNGFPNWFETLHGGFPTIVENIILNEIEWELSLSHEDSEVRYVLSDVIWYALLVLT